MVIFIQIIFLVVGFALLSKGADIFVDGAASLATKLGIPQLVIGLTIVAMGTSAPEAAVSINAAIKGNADITIGNVVGSNIINVLIILGISAIIVPLTVKKSVIKVDIPVMIGATILLLIFGFDGKVGLSDGIILTVVFLLYLAYLFIRTMKNSENDDNSKQMSIKKSVLFSILGLVLIIFGSDITVSAATLIAKYIGLSERFIALTIVALGTSLPELFTSITAARKGKADIAIGNIVGSNIFNILFVVALSALIIPVPFQPNFIKDTLVVLFSGVLLFVYCLPKKRLNRVGGIIMILCYCAYFAFVLI